jgi:hypothetical protein
MKVFLLSPIKPKATAKAIEEIIRNLDIASLLEPCVPGETHASQRCNLFAAKPFGTPARSYGQT